MVSKMHQLKSYALLLLAGFMLAACGGAPASNPNLGNSNDGNSDVNDGIITLSYVSATPDQLSLRGQGGNEASIVTFRVADTSDEPLAGVQVFMSLDSTVGGAALRGNQYATSDTSGLVSVTVISGTVSTVVHVVAQVVGRDVRVLSGDITISSGVPVYGHLAVGAEWRKEGTLDMVGTPVNFTVVASDQYGNYAFDGTRVSFWTPYYGAMDSSCTLESGACSATWLSTAGAGLVDPYNDPWVPVLVYTSGAELFLDSNGNNVFEDGETFFDIGEAYLDYNGNDQYDSNEFFVDANENGVRDEGNGVYDGPCLTDACDEDGSVIIWTEMWLYMCPEDTEGLGYPCEDE